MIWDIYSKIDMINMSAMMIWDNSKIDMINMSAMMIWDNSKINMINLSAMMIWDIYSKKYECNDDLRQFHERCD